MKIQHKIATSVLLLVISVFSATAQIGFGTNSPDPSAVVDMAATNKGMLVPRVALTSNTDVTTIASPAVGLLAFNKGTEGLTYVGYVFWNGTEWRTLSGLSLAPGTIGPITCSAVSLTPISYTSGTPFSGTLSVPYTGGNGGVYAAQSIDPVNGLTATLAAGNFALGAGTLTYHIAGTPTVTSPVTTTFNLDIGGQTCSATVGLGADIKAGELVYYKTGAIIPASIGVGDNAFAGNIASSWLSYYENDLPVIGGKLRLDGYFNAPALGPGSVSFNPRLVNVSSSPVRFHFSAMTTVDNFNTANIVLAPNNWVDLDNGIYNSYGSDNSTTAPPALPYVAVSPNGAGTSVAGSGTEIVQVDLSLDDKWYRVYYFPIVDNNDTSGTIGDNFRVIFLSIQRLY